MKKEDLVSNYARGAEMIYVGIRLQLKGGGKPNAKNMAVKNDRLKALKETVVKKASNIVIEQSTAVQPLTSVAQGTLDAFLKASENVGFKPWALSMPISKDAQHCGSSLCAILSGIV